MDEQPPDSASAAHPQAATHRRERQMLTTPAIRHLMTLDARGELTTAHVRLVAQTLDLHIRTVWKRLADAKANGTAERLSRARFEITEDLRVQLAYHRGNIKRLHEELRTEAEENNTTAPSLATLYRAIRRDLSPGDLAGLRQGLPASRGHDPHLRRPPVCRNEEWEGDHKQVPVLVLAGDRLLKPWVTWFIDCSTAMTMGWALTPHYPHRGSILAALRSAILRDDTHGPAGGLPQRLRIDRGRDFLARAVQEALGAFTVDVYILPPYTPHLKGSIENLNRAATSMFFSTLPRYTEAQRLDSRHRSGENDPPLTFEAFVELFGQWVRRRNAEHRMTARGNLTPLELWNEDDTPLREAAPEDLHAFLLEADRSTRKIQGHGIRWRGRDYIGPWMTGRTGTEVRIRYQPHHEDTIEVFDLHTHRHLGTAHLSDQADPDQINAVYQARNERAQRLRQDLRAAERKRRRRFKAATAPAPAQAEGAMTRKAATEELRTLRAPAHPDELPENYMPRRLAPGAGWVIPTTPCKTTSEEDSHES
ncbi:Mu transposase C-terminal domain-containing protein [Streptomyces sp. AgN23]|uniref:Mu transposase C-terminal domain-containing protein n=1 Tax=Streptomyces sp. AgN23 TaxID=1188315 RepID=UPI001B3436AA|nr:Mu transposase C-terminal domain-containing protein [Streptomyces sp. AgN23]QTI87237.1 transposase [Streptomyces sp. AgN23]QTI90637.1 transposase [Streptomyces sp. AgN23]WTB02827.1 transposase family protein [Streptomyces antimycoticus]WTB11293.1 transposase family protein [Streptomyces antimycoticus]